MHDTQAIMITMKNTALLDTPIPLHLCSGKVGLSPIAGVETAKWYFENEVDDFTPVMQ